MPDLEDIPADTGRRPTTALPAIVAHGVQPGARAQPQADLAPQPRMPPAARAAGGTIPPIVPLPQPVVDRLMHEGAVKDVVRSAAGTQLVRLVGSESEVLRRFLGGLVSARADAAGNIVLADDDISKVSHKLGRTMAFRQEWQLPGHLETVGGMDLWRKIQPFLPVGYHGHTPEGCAVNYWRMGAVSPAEILDAFDEDEIKRGWLMLVERGMQAQVVAAKAVGRREVQGMLLVMDLSGIGKKHLHTRGIEMLSAMFKLANKHFPENLRRVYIINTPSIFHGLFAIFKNVLSPRTIEKLVVSRDGNTAELLRTIGRSQLPRWAGGDDASCRIGHEWHPRVACTPINPGTVLPIEVSVPRQPLSQHPQLARVLRVEFETVHTGVPVYLFIHAGGRPVLARRQYLAHIHPQTVVVELPAGGVENYTLEFEASRGGFFSTAVALWHEHAVLPAAVVAMEADELAAAAKVSLQYMLQPVTPDAPPLPPSINTGSCGGGDSSSSGSSGGRVSGGAPTTPRAPSVSTDEAIATVANAPISHRWLSQASLNIMVVAAAAAAAVGSSALALVGARS